MEIEGESRKDREWEKGRNSPINSRISEATAKKGREQALGASGCFRTLPFLLSVANVFQWHLHPFIKPYQRLVIEVDLNC